MDAGGHLHLVGKARGQRGQKSLVAEKSVDTVLRGVDVVHDVQLQAALAALVAGLSTELQVILSAGYFPQVDICPFQNAVKVGIGLQHVRKRKKESLQNFSFCNDSLLLRKEGKKK